MLKTLTANNIIKASLKTHQVHHLFIAFHHQLLVYLLSHPQHHLCEVQVSVCHLLLLVQQPSLQHQPHSVLPNRVQLIITQVCNLAVPHLHRHWVSNESTETASPLNQLGNRSPKNLIQPPFFLTLFLAGSTTRICFFRYSIFQGGNLMIFQIFNTIQPRNRLPKDTSWFLKLQSLIEGVNDTNQEKLPHFFSLFIHRITHLNSQINTELLWEPS